MMSAATVAVLPLKVFAMRVFISSASIDTARTKFEPNSEAITRNPTSGKVPIYGLGAGKTTETPQLTVANEASGRIPMVP